MNDKPPPDVCIVRRKFEKQSRLRTLFDPGPARQLRAGDTLAEHITADCKQADGLLLNFHFHSSRQRFARPD
jgi:hypothetical protein